MGIPMLKIRRPLGRLIFNMGIAIPGKTVFLIETAPWYFYHHLSLSLLLWYWIYPIKMDILHKFHNAPLPYLTMHHSVTEMCTCVHISVIKCCNYVHISDTKWCIAGYLSDTLWDLWDWYIMHMDGVYFSGTRDNHTNTVTNSETCL